MASPAQHRAAPSNVALDADPVWLGEMRYVARQPILNLRGRVHAYELVFRAGPEAVVKACSEIGARTMLDNAVLFGLDWLTNGLPAFVPCTQESLTEDLVLVLAPHKTVLEIPAELEMTPRLLDSCRKLKARGFSLALDDFAWRPHLHPLAEMADYIRIGFDRFGMAERRYLRNLECASPAIVAMNVETQQDYQHACTEGLRLFQGNYFCHPVVLKKRKLPANRHLHFEIVRHLHHDPIDIRQVSDLVMQDASLTYRLLRLVNSPLYAIQQEVRNIDSAIIAMGEDAFRRIASLAVLSELNGDEPPEILHRALVRARFCESAAKLCGLDSGEQYLLGMLSLVPAMLRLPMEELTPSLPLRAAICEALQGTENRERCLLAWLECHERGDWAGCDGIAQGCGLNQHDLMRHFATSAVWAQASLHHAA